MPKSRIAPIPALAISVASATSSEIEKRSIPGIDSISSRTPSPATTKAGWIRWAAESSVSRTSPRKLSLRRSLRIRVLGNDIAAILGGGMGCPDVQRVAFSAVEARGLVKRYGNREALKSVDFAAQPGELVGVIGPNGAGKTTLLSILAGTLEPDEGEVSCPDGDVGWVPQQAAFYRRLTVEENLLLFARLEKGSACCSSRANSNRVSSTVNRR